MKKFLFFAFTLALLASCSTSNQVVSNKLFQKRKYQKGWHVNSSKKIDKVKKSTTTEVEESQVAHNVTTEAKPTAEKKSESKTESKVEKKENTGSAEAAKSKEVVVKDEVLLADEKNKDKSETEISEELTTKRIIEVIKEKIIPSAGIEKLREKTKTTKHSSGYSNLILILLCLFLSPVAVGLMRGWSSTEFLISLALFIVGYGIITFSKLASLAVLAGIVYAFLIMFDLV
ncbi:MAG: YqaE/Pmp3 family membrane protein [Flavobacteriales bacterium]